MDNHISARLKAPRNKTITLTQAETERLAKKFLRVNKPVSLKEIENRIICGDVFDVLDHMPSGFVDLLFVDPPYNVNKTFNLSSFKAMESDKYEMWLDSWMSKIVRLLKPTASIYICGDWKSSGAVFNVARKYFHIRNRITFEREKGRGAQANWKNASEDIWFCTMSDKYTFNTDDVKVKRKVIAPYRDASGMPKDWEESKDGNYRVTYPSNIWTDITIPFWSMSENTDHPTQKPEKLLAKVILASSNPNNVVFDPFIGSGTTAVASKKLDRRYVGIEIDKYYSALAQKRLEMADANRVIQGYSGGIFWERNSLK